MGPRLLLPQPKPPSGGPSIQESFVKRIIAVRVFVAYSTQKVQLSGDLNLDLNHVSDEELDSRISALLTPSQPSPEAGTPSGA
jgi:hypothetical protein